MMGVRPLMDFTAFDTRKIDEYAKQERGPADRRIRELAYFPCIGYNSGQADSESNESGVQIFMIKRRVLYE